MNIGEVAKEFNLSVSTLRYYDDIGILPKLKKDSKGNRIFDDNNIKTLKTIECLKNSGMSLKDIKVFIDMCCKGDSTLKQRLNMFAKQERIVNDEIKKLNKTLAMIKFKKAYYTQAVKDGTEDIIKCTSVDKMSSDMKKLYDKAQ